VPQSRRYAAILLPLPERKMPFTFEVVCHECGAELDAEENDSGQIEVQLCATCRARLLAEMPTPEPDPEQLEASE
jgi:DNA-directed RNA polymerase subunit RPC12/RpoP